MIDRLKDPELARVAGESFSMITGARLDYDKLEGSKPKCFEAGPTENPEGREGGHGAGPQPPLARPRLIQKWWKPTRATSSRALATCWASPSPRDPSRQTLKTGYQRQRAAAAIELAILKPGPPLSKSAPRLAAAGPAFMSRAPGPERTEDCREPPTEGDQSL